MSKEEILTFRKNWAIQCKKDGVDSVWICIDGSNDECESTGVEIAEKGHNKTGKNKKIVSFTYAVTQDGKPVTYDLYPGGLVDSIGMKKVIDFLKECEINIEGVILDRGHCTSRALRYLSEQKIRYIIMVKGCKDLVSQAIVENRGTFEDEWEKAIPYHDVSGTTVKRPIFKKDVEERCFHLYYSDFRKAKERTKLNHQIQEQKEFLEGLKGTETEIDKSFSPYFDLIYYEKEGKKILQVVREREDVISDAIKLCGYFCIITSSEMTAAEALELYKSRDDSEKLFRGDKSYLGARSERVYSGESIDTKIFIEFVATIIRNRIYTKLKDEAGRMDHRPNYMTVPAAISELEKIEMLKGADNAYVLDHAVTAKQKNILKAFGMTAANIQAQVNDLSSDLIRIEIEEFEAAAAKQDVEGS